MKKDLIYRERYLDTVRPFIGKQLIKVFTGQRRVGKSYLLFQIMQEIRSADEHAPIIYINKEDLAFSHLKTAQALADFVLSEKKHGQKNYVFIAYVTYALGLLILFTPVIGVILAFIKRDEAQGSIYASHIDWLIKTFWVSLIGLLLGRLTILILIGWLILLVTAIWFIYRVVVGLIKLNEDKPISTQGWF